MANYGTCSFNHWSDTGSTGNRKGVRRDSCRVPQTMTAVYNCGGNGTVDIGGRGAVTLTIMTSDMSGTRSPACISTLWQNGVQLQSCFSPCSFMVNSGQTYQMSHGRLWKCGFQTLERRHARQDIIP